MAAVVLLAGFVSPEGIFFWRLLVPTGWSAPFDPLKTANKTTQGTGNPHSDLEGRTRQELHNRANALDIDDRSKSRKEELIQAICEKN